MVPENRERGQNIAQDKEMKNGNQDDRLDRKTIPECVPDLHFSLSASQVINSREIESTKKKRQKMYKVFLFERKILVDCGLDKMIEGRSIQEGKRDQSEIKNVTSEIESKDEVTDHSQRLGTKKDGQDEMAEPPAFLLGS